MFNLKLNACQLYFVLKISQLEKKIKTNKTPTHTKPTTNTKQENCSDLHSSSDCREPVTISVLSLLVWHSHLGEMTYSYQEKLWYVLPGLNVTLYYKNHTLSLIIQSTWQARCNHYLHILLKIKNISLACTEVALPVVKVCCGLCHDPSASILPSYQCLGGDPLPERNVPLRERPAICGYGCAKATGPLAETQFHS